MVQTNKFNIVCEFLYVLYINLLQYLSNPNDPMICLRTYLIITSTAFRVATPGLGTPAIVFVKTLRRLRVNVSEERFYNYF